MQYQVIPAPVALIKILFMIHFTEKLKNILRIWGNITGKLTEKSISTLVWNFTFNLNQRFQYMA